MHLDNPRVIKALKYRFKSDPIIYAIRCQRYRPSRFDEPEPSPSGGVDSLLRRAHEQEGGGKGFKVASEASEEEVGVWRGRAGL